MEYRQIGKSGLKVSEITLGCGSSSFAGRADEATAISVIHRALDLGINSIDTAETYAEGRAETLIGKAVQGRRDDVIIATKFGKDRSVGPDEQRGSRRRVMRAVDASLKRLNTDYIDLYIFHEPDPGTPIEETLRALDDLIRAGKVRYIACSEFPAWKLCEALWTSRAHNYASFIAASSFYNLINRVIEEDVIPCCRAYGVGVVPTFPLAAGFLTGKYRRDQRPAGARFTAGPAFGNAIKHDLSQYDHFLTEANFQKLDRFEAFAQARGHTVGELAIAWLLSHPLVGTVPVGVTTAEQMTPHVKAASWKLTPDDLAALGEIL